MPLLRQRGEGDMRRRLFRLAICVEGGLILLAWILGRLAGHDPFDRILVSSAAVLQFVMLTMPLIVTALLLERIPFRGIGEIERFMNDVVRPLFRECRIRDLAWISMLAGTGEEIFFRGLIQELGIRYTGTVNGILMASVLFGAVHAITPLYALLAAVIGAYLGWTYVYSENLLVPIGIHALYDFALLVLLMRKSDVEKGGVPPPEFVVWSAEPESAKSKANAMKWYQRKLTLPRFGRGFHIITSHVLAVVPELPRIRAGQLHIFIHHTSASLSINENYDVRVRRDLESHFTRMVPEEMELYEHDAEGPDDMPAHIKSSLLGASLTIPVTEGRLALGTWQGIYLCEHRDHAGKRTITITLSGVEED